MSVEALVADIRTDVEVARRSVERKAYRDWRGDEWLLGEVLRGRGSSRGGMGDEKREGKKETENENEKEREREKDVVR